MEAPSHLLVVQKNEHKKSFSEREELLLGTVERENEIGKYFVNAYVARHEGLILADEILEGTNQYGKAARVFWHNGELAELEAPLKEQIGQQRTTKAAPDDLIVTQTTSDLGRAILKSVY